MRHSRLRSKWVAPLDCLATTLNARRQPRKSRRMTCEALEQRQLLAVSLGGLAMTPANISEGGISHLTGTISDTDIEPYTLSVDWGDGSAKENFSLVKGATTFDVAHAYLDQPAAVLSGPFDVNVQLQPIGDLSINPPVSTLYVNPIGDQSGNSLALVNGKLYVAGTNQTAGGGLLLSYDAATLTAASTPAWIDPLAPQSSLSGIAVTGTQVVAVGNVGQTGGIYPYGATDTVTLDPKALLAWCNINGAALKGDAQHRSEYLPRHRGLHRCHYGGGRRP